MADQFVVRADRLHVIPDDMSDLDAALIEPLSTPVPRGPNRRVASGSRGRRARGGHDRAAHARGGAVVRRLQGRRYRSVARQTRGGHSAWCRRRRRRNGPDVAAQVRAALGESADVVFDCVAVKSTTLSAIDMALKGGTVVIVGVPAADFELPIRIMQDQQIRLQGSATYVPQDYVAAIEMIQSGAVRAEDFITGQFPLEQAEQAFEASMSGDHIKVLIYP